MMKLFAVACCFLLAGCAAGDGLSGSGGIDEMQGDGQIYTPRQGEFYAPPSTETRPTSTCRMRGQGAQCF